MGGPYLAVEMEPGLKWLGYLMWHLGTVSTLLLMAGYAAAALSSDLHVLDCDRAGGGGVGGLMHPTLSSRALVCTCPIEVQRGRRLHPWRRPSARGQSPPG